MGQTVQKQPHDVNESVALEHGLTKEEYQSIHEILGRVPNLVELGIFSVMWSEHCSYKTTRKWLSQLPTTGAKVICGPGENAGVIDIGDGQAVIFKMESHNHPSFIEPYQGAATGVGGILRDVFTMGARPIALMNALRFGAPTHPRTKHLVSGVVRGIGGYGNCVGVPTIGGETNFDEAYNGNILVNAMAVGLADQDKIFYSAAAGLGNPVVYVGAKTGRDGIHGATMASAEFDENSEEKRPTVQVGDPFTEKLLIEACLELMQTDAVISIQDMGAAGLTCSSLEMAGKGGLGIELVLDDVPQRETGMTPYEIMLSESQERMLMVLRPDSVEMAYAIFRKWDLDFATIGTLTDTGRMVLKWRGEVVGDMPIAPISTASPVLDRPYQIVCADEALPAWSIKETSLTDVMKRMLALPDLASKRWIWEQYDHRVMNNTIVKPSCDASVVRIQGMSKGLAISTDCTPRYCKASPFEGGKQAVAECWRNIIATGAEPIAITNCLNFGNPEKPEIMGQLVGSLQGMAEACRVLDFPVVSGNVSLYNETNGASILPTPAIGGVGVIADVEDAITIGVNKAGDVLMLVGETKGHLGASLFLRDVAQVRAGLPPKVVLEQERLHGLFVRKLILKGLISACHDVSDGGLMIAIAEMVMAGGMGATVNLPYKNNAWAMLFGEDQARYVLAVPPSSVASVQTWAEEQNVPCAVIGAVGGGSLIVNQETIATVAELRTMHEAWMPQFMS
ncbi:MAG: phosphoribosylformylglycinamidine synthase subunit PurL [Alphaproteobacteria bacterium]|nr:MAG: phosphoribosylformylglycinamidine synthase subunit PurL [Alphaproteobacteria bacterium]TAF13345.1 MAG: phosphoribosylformylglycinamidine synthase subunit PurL [Alphaproteobacteria bacterium]TAF38503.1 MAG: phosphoribosylformylglycinamidine synthase subunit PurL [Alphaproteobacteria bacterium]TAF75469.1 MAG: phosphoribosylformylglycinamidine synthase subunit PurL [Alphaproteobacteria bacterium]